MSQRSLRILIIDENAVRAAILEEDCASRMVLTVATRSRSTTFATW